MCPSNCGPLYKPGTDLRDTTCPCGFGYFDRSGFFVAGDRVRDGQALSREAYATHPPSCPVSVDPRNRYPDQELYHPGDYDSGFHDYFVPKTDVDLEVLETYLARDGPNASVTQRTFNEQPGYVIHARQRPNKEFLANIKRDSADIGDSRRKYGSKMPHWSPIGSGLQVQGSRETRQNISQSIQTPEGRTDYFESSQQSVPGDRGGPTPTNVAQSLLHTSRYASPYVSRQQQSLSTSPSYSYPGSHHPPLQAQYTTFPTQRSLFDQQTSLVDRFGQLSLSQSPDRSLYGTETHALREQSVVPDSWSQQQRGEDSLLSPPDSPTAERSTGSARNGEPYPQMAPRYDRHGNMIAADGRDPWEDPRYQTTTDPRRSSTSTAGDPSRASSHDLPQTQDPRTYQARGGRPELTYTDRRYLRDVTIASTRPTYNDARDPLSTRSSRREPASVSRSAGVDEEPWKRSPERGSRG